jgi:hypothetical protein
LGSTSTPNSGALARLPGGSIEAFSIPAASGAIGDPRNANLEMRANLILPTTRVANVEISILNPKVGLEENAN